MSADKPSSLVPATALVATAGLLVSIYLSIVHYKVHFEPGHVSLCAVNEQFNCDTVALSDLSRVLGAPISVWGALFYSVLAVLLGWAYVDGRPRWPWAVVGLASAAALFATLSLALVSHLQIRSLCLFCATLYGVNLALAGLCLFGHRRTGLPLAPAVFAMLLACAAAGVGHILLFGASGPAILLAALFGVAGVVAAVRGGMAGLRAWCQAIGRDIAVVFERPLRGALLTTLLLGLALAAALGFGALYKERQTEIAGGLVDIESGHTEDGHAWIGSPHPEVTVFEYSDYECPFCRKAHEILREVVRENKDWLRLVHVHMPLDMSCNKKLEEPFHLNSCTLAVAAICADQAGLFWKMNDRLFIRRGGLDKGGLTVLAGQLGLDEESFHTCLDSEQASGLLGRDLAECDALELRPATPTFRVGRQVITGMKDHAYWTDTLKSLRPTTEPAAREPAPQSGDANGIQGAGGG